MKYRDKDPDEVLDELLSGLRQTEMDAEDLSTSAGTVWSKLSREDIQSFEGPPETVERIRNCGDVQNLLPAFVRGELIDARRLLVSDHLRECISCRRAFRQLKEGRSEAVPLPAVRATGLSWKAVGWAAAAVGVLGVSLTYLGFLDSFLPAPAGPRAVVAAVDGTLFRISPEGSTALTAGDGIGDADELRTARGSGAILTLRDGSRLEIGERAQLSLTENKGGKTIDLVRGRIIVEAAEQQAGFLRVATDDCLVSVKGTVFSVNRGTKGSRVSVIEGTVAVELESGSRLLTSGQQVSSSSNLGPVPLEREIAWSRNATHHLALLHELASLRKEIESSLVPVVHSSTTLLDLVPKDTVIYVSIPNLTTALDETFSVFQQRLAESVVLQQWWADQGSELEPRIRETLDRLSAFGSLLNEELVIGLQLDEKGDPSEPFALALVSDESSFRALLEQEIARLNAEIAQQTVVALLEDPFAGTPDKSFKGLYVSVRDRLFMASPSLEKLRQLTQSAASGGESFVGTPFYHRIAQAYQEGIGFLVAVDLHSMLAGQLEGETDGDLRALEAIGVLDAEHIIVERKPSGSHSETRAVISFAEARRGLASWLAEPAPMGALEFVSADAVAVAAFAVKDPALMVDDLFQVVGSVDPDALAEAAAFEAEKGIRIREDIAFPLGGELVFALDGPILPQPAWKLVLEVYDPVAFQETLSWLIGQVNLEAGTEGPQLELLTNQASGKTYYTVVSAKADWAFHYVFVDGYLVAAPNQALLVEAMQFRETGYTFPTSTRFAALMPEDGRANFSGFFYQDFASLLNTLSNQLPTSIGGISPDDLASIRMVLSQAEPTLMYAYGEADQITLATTGDALAPFSLGAVLGLASPMGVGRLLGELDLEEGDAEHHVVR